MGKFEQHQNKTIKDSSNVEKMKNKLSTLNFKNGSKIEPIITKEKVVISKNAQLISFYCPYCKTIHVDYDFINNEFVILDDKMYCYRVLELLDEGVNDE